MIDHATQTQILVNAILKARGESGANQADVLTVVSWARGVHSAGAELKTLAARVRKSRTDGTAGRQINYDVNKALLDGVLAGQLTVNVDEAGNVVFGDASAVPAASE